jgi:hypothetical protein
VLLLPTWRARESDCLLPSFADDEASERMRSRPAENAGWRLDDEEVTMEHVDLTKQR